VAVRGAELREGRGHALDADGAGDERLAGISPPGDVTEGRGELLGGAAEDELHAQLLADAEQRVDSVHLRADADHDDPPSVHTRCGPAHAKVVVWLQVRELACPRTAHPPPAPALTW
jgi:hypothetical protein